MTNELLHIYIHTYIPEHLGQLLMLPYPMLGTEGTSMLHNTCITK